MLILGATISSPVIKFSSHLLMVKLKAANQVSLNNPEGKGFSCNFYFLVIDSVISVFVPGFNTD